ncbi:uncharacterized protein LOC128736688 [Sabethes cyaneus]|uniref:uncharacterized protein LOC128736688 n=1 Tax=Sabethes cyaneus TaxID=53552 RepID=UPI00237DB5C0|nr:uncharacterized protein LOC128736688 [Sabethes cyaneus]
MTMSALLKQTKKCCVKMIRKFSFNPNGGSSSSPPGVGSRGLGGSGSMAGGGGGRSISLNNRATAKYVLHKNCTPTRCKVQPTSPERNGAAGWTATGTDEEDSSPRGVRRRLDLSPKPELPDIPPTQNNYSVSRDGKNLPKKRTNICSNKNVNLRKCFRMRKGFKEELSSEEVNNSNSVVSSKLDKISKTLYNVAGGSGVENGENRLFGGVNANNLVSQTSEKSKISKPLFLSGKHKKYNQIETQFGADDGVDFEDDEDDEFVACELDGFREGSTPYDGGRLQFEISEPLPDLEVSPLPGGSGTGYDEIIFEKVKYDQSKRYLRNGTTSSPSTASNRSQNGSCLAHSVDSTLSVSFECKFDHHLPQFGGEVVSKQDDFMDPWRNYNVSSRWNKVSKSPWEYEAQKVDSPPAMSPLGPSSWNPFSEEPTEPSSTPPQLATSKTFPPPYQVRTDIWASLHNKNYEIDSDVVWRTSNSSRRTSASTVETWIEDEVFDNSFNEELERRCATLKI